MLRYARMSSFPESLNEQQCLGGALAVPCGIDTALIAVKLRDSVISLDSLKTSNTGRT